MAWLPVRKTILTGGAALALAGGGTAAGAAIASGPVDGSGVIHGCYTSKALHGSHVFVLQDAGTTCPAGTMAISWNQQGPPGPAGPAGAPGTQGPAGPAGTPGTPGPAGPAGANGNTVLSGTGGPASSLGNDGDFYLDTAADVLYGPKAGGSWPSPGVSLVGSTGPAGSQGPAGTPGAGVTVTPLQAGDPNCPAGGASITDSYQNTAYACNGLVNLTNTAVTVSVTEQANQPVPGFAVATCPSSAPYVTGGGAHVVVQDGTSPSTPQPELSESYPAPGDPSGGTPGSWHATALFPAGSDTGSVTVFAVCTDSRQF